MTIIILIIPYVNEHFYIKELTYTVPSIVAIMNSVFVKYWTHFNTLVVATDLAKYSPPHHLDTISFEWIVIISIHVLYSFLTASPTNDKVLSKSR